MEGSPAIVYFRKSSVFRFYKRSLEACLELQCTPKPKAYLWKKWMSFLEKVYCHRQLLVLSFITSLLLDQKRYEASHSPADFFRSPHRPPSQDRPKPSDGWYKRVFPFNITSKKDKESYAPLQDVDGYDRECDDILEDAEEEYEMLEHDVAGPSGSRR